ncbi:uncharacterized protein LOC114957937 [Acropora millepora]|uniref:uncharacterized protein LOC114957937 n=1 Tax=Acropora millepora TaxID=45264 RepID=UPI001CF0F0F0|nr:uncharacterized protein LOC114957937 [Acropora millepora]
MGNGSKDKDGESSQPLVGSSKGDVEAGEDGITSDKCQKKKTCGSKCLACFRCVFGFVMFPFVFLITLLTAFLWIILLPAKCCSPCCIPLFDWLVEVLLLPVRFYRWVVGKDQDERK